MTYSQAAKLLSSKDQILILTHLRPDGDTIGCAAALCHGLRAMGKTAYVAPNEDAHNLFTPYLEPVLAPDDFTPAFVVSVDTASLDLIPESVSHLKNQIDLCIDHHGSNDFFAHESCVMPEHAACGEILFLILKELGPITPDIALLLYVAISTDTGCFMFSNTTPETHRIAAELMTIGFDCNWVNKRHFRTKSLRRLRLEGKLIQDMTFLDEGRTAIAPISLETLASIGATEEDLENIASFLEQVEGVENAATIRELKPGECKISLRSGASLNASSVCALFGGGGHPSAAGCSISGSIEDATQAIIQAIRTIQNT